MTLAQVAKDLGVHLMTSNKWMRKAAIDDGARPAQGRVGGELTELHEARRRVRLLELKNKLLRRAAAYLSQANLPGQGSSPREREVPPPLVSELASDGIPVAVTCQVLKIARQRYYRWLKKHVTDTEYVRANRANAHFDAHRDEPEFGYRYLADEARHHGGQPMTDRPA